MKKFKAKRTIRKWIRSYKRNGKKVNGYWRIHKINILIGFKEKDEKI